MDRSGAMENVVGSTSTQSAVAPRSDLSDSELFSSLDGAKWTEALKEGERVEVSGLMSAAHHNGKCGVLGPFLQGENRWVVHLDSGGTPLKVRQENLTGLIECYNCGSLMLRDKRAVAALLPDTGLHWISLPATRFACRFGRHSSYRSCSATPACTRPM